MCSSWHNAHNHLLFKGTTMSTMNLLWGVFFLFAIIRVLLSVLIIYWTSESSNLQKEEKKIDLISSRWTLLFQFVWFSALQRSKARASESRKWCLPEQLWFSTAIKPPSPTSRNTPSPTSRNTLPPTEEILYNWLTKEGCCWPTHAEITTMWKLCWICKHYLQSSRQH